MEGCNQDSISLHWTPILEPLSVLLPTDPYLSIFIYIYFVYYINNKINYVKYIDTACKIAKIDKIKVI